MKSRVLAHGRLTNKKHSSDLQTFAVGNTLLNSHIARRQRRTEDESIGITGAAILKATGVDKRLKLVQARRHLHVPGMRGCHKRERGNRGHEGPGERHFDNEDFQESLRHPRLA